MRLHVIICCFSVFCLSFLPQVFGQNQSVEFIESSSPLPDGGKVVSRSTPGNEIQTVTTSPTNSSRSVLDNRSSVNETSQRNSVLKQAATTSITPQYRYPYPASRGIAPRIAQGGLFYPPVRASRTCTNCAVPFQLPTLGISGTTTTARQVYGTGNCCAPQINPTTTLQVPALQAPVLQVQPPASQVPSLAVPQQNPAAFSPGFNPGFQAVPPPPGVGTPQFGSQANTFWTPFVTGSGVYQPVIRIANLRPGTYLGQGIIGQPTAYVDGQPLRNLLRYIFP